MSVHKWSVEEEHLLRLLRPTNTYQEIEIEFQKRVDRELVGFRCIRSADAIRKKCTRDNITATNTIEYADGDTIINVHWNHLQEIQDQYDKSHLTHRRGIIAPEDLTTKILSLSDIHFPMAKLNFLKEALDEHSDADVVVLNGDILDGYIFSSFEKHKRIAALDEYNCTFNFVQHLSENFPAVVLVEGNHDNRVGRALKLAGFPKEATQILRPCLLARIANGERLDQTGIITEKLDFKNVIFDQQESWYTIIGKTVFIHPSTRGNSKPGYTVNLWYDKFKERYDPGEFDSIVCGHTHKLYKGIVNSVMLIEQGCLEGFTSYAWDPRVAYKNNGQNGYAVIYQDAEGNTCFNRSGFRYLGEIMPPKKSAI